MSARRKGDVRLELHQIPVTFTDGSIGVATAEGNNAAWPCRCGEQLMGRCYFQFGHSCYTACHCGRVFRVAGDERKRATEVRETVARESAA